MMFTKTKYRLRSSSAFENRDSGMVGVIEAIRTHQSNNRSMLRIEFDRPEHQKLWANAWFYRDDIEEVQ